MTYTTIDTETSMDWGGNTVFGLPGDGANGLVEALSKRQDQVQFAQVCNGLITVYPQNMNSETTPAAAATREKR